MTIATPKCSAPLLVVCLCAQWCRVCDDYRSRFQQVQKDVVVDYPQASFLWLDVEDEADLLHPLDVENFPTLLIAVDAQLLFFGALTPQAATLNRLVRSLAQDAAAPALTQPELTALVARIGQTDTSAWLA